MQATLIEKYSPNTALYHVDPPMKFLKQSFRLSPDLPVIVESSQVVIHTADIHPDFSRTVIHLAQSLSGDDGVSYGETHRMLDGVAGHAEALELAGYKIQP